MISSKLKIIKKYLLSIIFALLAGPSFLFANVTIHVLDVGYGQAIHVESGFQHYLFDVGPKEASQRLIQFLSSRKVTRLNAIFLSHTHPDHVGGLMPLLSQIQTERVFWNEMLPPTEDAALEFDAAERLSPFQKLAPGNQLQLGKNLKLTVLKSSLSSNDLNDNSLVFGLESGGNKILFAGDAGPARQLDLVQLEPKWLKKPDLFVWPHHGDQLHPQFRKALKKSDFCVVSIGKNEYGLPAAAFETQSKLLCKETYRTDQTGHLIFYVGRKKIKLGNRGAAQK